MTSRIGQRERDLSKCPVRHQEWLPAPQPSSETECGRCVNEDDRAPHGGPAAERAREAITVTVSDLHRGERRGVATAWCEPGRSGEGPPAGMPEPGSHASARRHTLPAARLALALGPVTSAVPVAAAAQHRLPVVVLALTFVWLLAVGGLVRPALAPSLLDEMPRLAGRFGAALGVTFALTVVASVQVVPALLVHQAVLVFGLTVLLRHLTYSTLRRARRRGMPGRPTVVVGCGDMGGRIVEHLTEHPEYGLLPVGFVDERPLLPPSQRAVPVIARLRDLPKVLAGGEVAVVIVAFGGLSDSAAVDVLRVCERLDVEVFVVPRFYEVSSSTPGDEAVCGVPLVLLRRPAFRVPTWRLKRCLDVAVAMVGLFVAAPVMAACAIAVRLEGEGPVLFRQERVGLDGRPFTVLKFRSLKPDDDEESRTRWTVAGDERLGTVGRTLRRLSLDELPQLWNVLRGDMSLVGPRPERKHFVDRFTMEHEEYVWRHRVPVGLTGLAQVNGLRGDTSIRDRARLDNHYIANWSLWLDIKIGLRTAAELLRGA